MARLTKKLKKQGITQRMLDKAKREGGLSLEGSGNQSGRSKSVRADKKDTALSPGKRLSRNGTIYYESRRNRSDKSRKKRI